MHPDKEVPEEFRTDIVRTLRPKHFVVENSRASLREIKEKFPLEKVDKRAKRNSNIDQPSTSRVINGGTLFRKPSDEDATSSSSTLDGVYTYGAINSSHSRIKILSLLRYSSAYQPIQLAVEDLLSTASKNVDVFTDALKALRQKCSIQNPRVYNDWIPRVKEAIEKGNLVQYWNVIVDGNYLITRRLNFCAKN
jgi:hypothetical protein